MTGGLLVADVGGTNSRFAIVSGETGKLRATRFARLSGDDYETFEEAVSAYLAGCEERPMRACFALAGPVNRGRVNLTNRNWSVSEAALRETFGFHDALLINDFTAWARAVPETPAGSFEEILPGQVVDGEPILVAGTGTGFGVATLLPDGAAGWRILSGEGGHMAYAPRTPLEFDIFLRLRQTHAYVSNELIASGSGLPSLHVAFCEAFGKPYEPVSPEEVRARAASGDEMCRALIEMQACATMGAVGDLALANGARGGVVLVGGMTERLADILRSPAAAARFRDRGPMSAFLEACPVRLMRDAEAPLIGAAAYYRQVRG